jgi:3-hydroxyisobutyrate dehydrogenase-like beta-hydroxyacid dehydrogenase
MGSRMAMRLVHAGDSLCVFDRDPDAMAPFLARGATDATSPADLASRVQTVLLCLPTPDVMHSVVLGEEGVVHGSSARTVVDLGTTGPVMARTVAAGTAAHGVAFVDAPVTGGLAGATAGLLAIMVSCPRTTLADLDPVLSRLGRVYYTGEAPGLAQTAKLANNLLSAAALAVSSEAMAMGVKAGIDSRVLLDIINAGSGRNSATDDKFPRAILPGTFDFGMNTALFLKDVRLCLDEAEALGVPMVVGSAVRQMFAATLARFGPQSDFTCIAKLVEEWGRVEIRE